MILRTVFALSRSGCYTRYRCDCCRSSCSTTDDVSGSSGLSTMTCAMSRDRAHTNVYSSHRGGWSPGGSAWSSHAGRTARVEAGSRRPGYNAGSSLGNFDIQTNVKRRLTRGRIRNRIALRKTTLVRPTTAGCRPSIGALRPSSTASSGNRRKNRNKNWALLVHVVISKYDGIEFVYRMKMPLSDLAIYHTHYTDEAVQTHWKIKCFEYLNSIEIRLNF